MDVKRISLGTIQSRGAKLLDPGLVSFGPKESDFLVRHVEKVRELDEASPRGVFTTSSYVPDLLRALLTCSDLQFEQHSKTLQDRLAKLMGTSTNAKDCVFAVVHTEQSGVQDQITILKLDAVVEAAETGTLQGKVTLKVLEKLIPEPGKLQKALSWPDPRATSDAILIDANFTQAEYFSSAFDIGASPRSPDAEKALHKALVASVNPASLGAALADAAVLEGPADAVLASLATTYPELTPVAQATARDVRPAGMIRKNKISALPLVWTADGAKLTIPSSKAGSVEITPDPAGQGWLLILHTAGRPTLEQ
ncbi:MAG TPA: nucleoid-associated protein [Galbitalea sp.]|nr:nucleoid-associated protein [Galbitalea sp.]